MKRLAFGLTALLPIAGIFCLSGCGKQPQLTLEQKVESKIGSYTQPAIEKLYGKVLTQEELESLNTCVAKTFTSKLTQEERLFLGGSAVQQAQYAKTASSSITEKAKPTSPEMKEVIIRCNAELGIKKAASKLSK